jgi:hypothetical protein
MAMDLSNDTTIRLIKSGQLVPLKYDIFRRIRFFLITYTELETPPISDSVFSLMFS